MPVDFLGREFQISDLVVYPGRKGSSLWMNKAQVLDILVYKGGHHLRVRRDDGKIKTLSCLDRVVIVPSGVPTHELDQHNNCFKES